MGRRKTVSNCSTGKKYKQLEISQYFSSCSKGSAVFENKMKCVKAKRQLFMSNTITVHDSDSDSNTDLGETFNTSANGSSHDLLERPTVEISLNKSAVQPSVIEKLKPRILQTKINSEESTSGNCQEIDKSYVSPSLSGCSENTIIYDPEELQETINNLLYSPAASLLQKVDRNIESTKSSTLAYKKLNVIFSPTKSPLKRSPSKSPRSPIKSPRKSRTVEEIVNPRIVNMITRIIKYVFSQEHLKNLFTEDEVNILSRFYEMPRPEYNFLCYKLFTRLPKWYNIHKLCENINLKLNTQEIIEMHGFLGQAGFVYTDYTEMPLPQLMDLLQSADVREICDSFRLKIKSGKKADLIEYLLNHTGKQATLTQTKSTSQILRERVYRKLGLCVKLSDNLYDLLNRAHTVYTLGSSEFAKPHDLYQFLDQIEYKDIVMPEISVDVSSPIFESRDEFLSFSKAAEYKNALILAFENKNRETMREICCNVYAKLKELLDYGLPPQKPSFLIRLTAGWKYASALTMGTVHLVAFCPSSVKIWLELLLSQYVYCQNKRGLWYDQLALIYTKYHKDFRMGGEIIIKALKDERLTEDSRHDLSIRGKAIKSSKKNKVDADIHDLITLNLVEPPDYEAFPTIVIDARAVQGNESGRKRMYVETQDNGEKHFLSVESVALNHYFKEDFTNGIHCEGSLLVTLFCILFWDIIYNCEVPLAFISEIQYLPMDLYGEEFYLNRKSHVDKRLQEIKTDWSDEVFRQFIIDNWERHSHKKSLITKSVVNGSLQLLECALCIGRKCLADIMKRMVCNFRDCHSGLPDLFVWNAAQQKCRFVEVKGENDKLSTKQKLWLNYLRGIGASVEVCHVHTIGSRGNERAKRLKTENSTKKPPEQE